MSRSRDGYHHGDLAVALEDAAMQLLATRPAAQISLREVARAANVSHNAPYHHFADRQGLLKVLAERSMAELVASARDAVEAGADGPDRLRALGVAYIRFAATQPHAFEAVYDPTVCVPGQPTERMAPLIAELEQLVGEVTAAVGITEAQAMWGLVHGLGTLVGSGHVQLDDALAEYQGLLARMLPA